uniref:E3 ubiquitin-protein ligase RNF220 n=1 Tax=Oryzias latipes TaxID=8090 RepID=A0A3P9IM34_ORYLA
MHLHHQFTPPNLDCTTLGMLNHSGVGAFRPFSSPPEEREPGGYQSAFTPAKRLKSCFPEVEGKEFDFGSLKAEETGRKLFSMSGLLSNGEASLSPEERKEQSKVKGLYDTQMPVCPVCQTVLRPAELHEHMEQELAKLAQLQISPTPVQHVQFLRTPKSLSLSLRIKREGGSPASPPRPSEDAHSDRYQTFLRVRSNRHTRLNVRIGKLKIRKPEEGQEGSAALTTLENDWNETTRMQMTSAGFKAGAVLVRTTSKEFRDSDVDLDVDGDDTLEYGKVQYTETDVIPCSGESSKESAVNSSRNVLPDSRVNTDFPKWSNDGSPSTSTAEKPDSGAATLSKTCKNTNIETPSEDSTLTTLDALKARIRDLEKQLSKGDRFKCLICMDTYTTPLTSIQCWHVHCEECWLRTLGAKKLCPQCNTITSPGDLRRVFL